jgi:calcium permeable stress-gated cation channel
VHWLTDTSTGKRRYGHPALNGILPQPWLPLKKGQSIRNGPPSAPNTSSVDVTPAVVLTLRKRYSVRGEPTRPTRSGGPEESPESPTVLTESTIGNPWEDAVSPTAERTGQLQRRLSFDHASGVIMLPDEEDWLEAESDSDEDYGVQRGDANVPENGATDTVPQPPIHSPTSSKRYATYYHHPERRKRP